MTDAKRIPTRTGRRRFLAAGATALTLSGLSRAGLGIGAGPAAAQTGAQTGAPTAGPVLRRTIPSTGDTLPAVGLGSWITFNVGDDPVLRADCAEVMAAFLDAGGSVIDSSPMYGSSQAVIGAGLERLGRRDAAFSADKVWTGDTDEGRAQIERSRENWRVPRFDLVQVHNLVEWEAHLDTLAAMKAAGEVRYVGITTSHGRRHGDFEAIMRSQDLDFVQLTYNPVDREAEDRLLPLARERGMAVLVNRPFRRDALTRRLEGEPLPGWASELGAETWAQLVLKFILSHPAATIPIPATTKPEHALENVLAATGPLPDDALRERLARHIQDI
ncbi:aldo/keto reductase [Thalassobaculum litoreum]|uniref:Aldo/keto reductase n=1 Tax=Thalassobaculum litoreum DSM 18839 TaxID=1123362 RepID=A0A8G2BKG2_9PROT|nr:aldo/keto reductase [Thalassobaculum litoreum]SDG22092.1 Aldo/keto reductase [Thalassobaculum litoreum DSM 18839]